MNAILVVLAMIATAPATERRVFEFDDYAVRWVPTPTGYRAELVDHPDTPVAWAPLPGSQHQFLTDDTFEVLFAGSRGNGKSDALLMDFGRDVGKGHGAAWKGLLFRRTTGELAEVKARAQKLFPAIFPAAVYMAGSRTWRFPGGEELTFGYLDSFEDYDRYHGWERPWIGFEELSLWSSDRYYTRIMSTMRSTNPNVPLRIRSNTNPSGPGHSWIKERFRLPLLADQVAGKIIHEPGERPRRVICGYFHENFILLSATPDYADVIRTSATSEAEERAWLENDWNVVAGGMFNDVWRPRVHVVPPVPVEKVPPTWRLDRSYDDGQSKPFGVLWFAESNGEPFEWEGVQLGAVRGDVIAAGEWYGWNGKRTNVGCEMPSREIAEGIVAREADWKVAGRVRRGPADTAIWNASATDRRTSVASEMLKAGVAWERADKGPGSREQGWKRIREMLRAAVPDGEGRRSKPGLFISENCVHLMRTLLSLPRDPQKPDDADTDADDHLPDALRYRLRRVPPASTKHKPLLHP